MSESNKPFEFNSTDFTRILALAAPRLAEERKDDQIREIVGHSALLYGAIQVITGEGGVKFGGGHRLERIVEEDGTETVLLHMDPALMELMDKQGEQLREFFHRRDKMGE